MLKDPIVAQDPTIDFICFTDQNFKSKIWKLKPIPEDLRYLSNVKKQRILKICPHRYLKEYDVSIWVDGNIQIVGDLNKFMSQYDLEKTPFYTRVHPSRKCIYDEAKACIDFGKDSSNTIKSQIDIYKKECYPKKAGMVETCILLRKHNDIRCQMICNMWATELLNHSHRDQLSFNYICWKNHFLPGILKNEFKVASNFTDTFRLCNHG